MPRVKSLIALFTRTREIVVEDGTSQQQRQSNEQTIKKKQLEEEEKKVRYDMIWLEREFLQNPGLTVQELSLDRAGEIIQSWGENSKEEENSQLKKKYMQLCVDLAEHLKLDERFDLEEAFRAEIVRRETLENDFPLLLGALQALAECLYHQRKYEKAYETFRNVYEVAAKEQKGGEETLAVALGNMAIVKHDLFLHEDADRYYQEALQVQSQSMKKGMSEDEQLVTATTATIAHNFATSMHQQERFTEAEELYRRNIQDTGDLKHEGAALSRNNLGVLLLKQERDLNEAETLVRDAALLLGPEHEHIGQVAANLSELLRTQEKFEANQVGGAHGNIVNIAPGIISKKEDNAATFDIEAEFYERVGNLGDSLMMVMPRLERVVRDTTPRILMLEDITWLITSPQQGGGSSPSRPLARSTATSSKTRNAHGIDPLKTFALSHESTSSLRKSTKLNTTSGEVGEMKANGEEIDHPLDKPTPKQSSSPSNPSCSIMDVKLGYRSFRHDAPNSPQVHYFTKYSQVLEEEEYFHVDEETRETRLRQIWLRAIQDENGPVDLKNGKLGKHDYLSFRDAMTTSMSHGFRLTALHTAEGYSVSQEEGKGITSLTEFSERLKLFSPEPAIIQRYIEELDEVTKRIQESTLFRSLEFVGTSLLLCHSDTKAVIRWIDFANVSEGASLDGNGILQGIGALRQCFLNLLPLSSES